MVLYPIWNCREVPVTNRKCPRSKKLENLSNKIIRKIKFCSFPININEVSSSLTCFYQPLLYYPPGDSWYYYCYRANMYAWLEQMQRTVFRVRVSRGGGTGYSLPNAPTLLSLIRLLYPVHYCRRRDRYESFTSTIVPYTTEAKTLRTLKLRQSFLLNFRGQKGGR